MKNTIVVALALIVINLTQADKATPVVTNSEAKQESSALVVAESTQTPIAQAPVEPVKPVEPPQAPVVEKKPDIPAPTANKSYAHATCAQYESLVKQYDWDFKTAMAIMEAESGCRADARGGPNTNGTYDYGLFQLNQIVITDPAANIATAYRQKYLKGGWKHWSVYNNGAYKKYL